MPTYGNNIFTRYLRLWLGISLTALLIFIVVKTYLFFMSSKIPVIMTGIDGRPIVVSIIQPFKNSTILYNFLLTLIIAIILSSISSILIYTSLTRGSATVLTKPSPDGEGGMPVPMPLTDLEKRALRIIKKRGGVITQAELGRQLGLSKYQVSRLVKKLEVKGLIERRRAGVTNILILRGGSKLVNGSNE
ncbi:helix-turn-helix transcriptional regulator [Vulcanisaeta thermophila]|uniref:helix-turn-helix transcriptional regulator n=1 Tax=Vulcanisaeta thermophila TaxID=867917 RepID=UPI000853D21C|nr:MarR family transcriptional regulator [Vulcanisaeta thermophila]